MPVRVLIADDHTLFREMLRQTLDGKGDTYTVIGEAADGPETLRLVSRIATISSFWITGCLAWTASPPFAARWAGTRTLLVTGFREEEIAVEAAIGGVRGYLLKGAPISELLTAMGVVHAEGIWVDAHLPRQVFKTFLSRSRKWDDSVAKLTRQELKILALMAHGSRNYEISSHLHISQKTVKNHLTHIFSKLRVRSRQQAVNRLLGGQEENSPEVKTSSDHYASVRHTSN